MPERVFAHDALKLFGVGANVGIVLGGRVELPAGFQLKMCRSVGELVLALGSWPKVQLAAVAADPPLGITAIANSRTGLSLAVEFACHLCDIRGGECHVVQTQPSVDDKQVVAFPHLVLVDGRERYSVVTNDLVRHVAAIPPDLEDRVLWEVMPRRRLAAFGIDESVMNYWRERLDDLIELRIAVRNGTIVPGFADALGDRYLSFRFVCEHHDLVCQFAGAGP